MPAKTNIERTLGATYPVGASQVVLFIPDRDREDTSIDQQYWVEEALNVLLHRFGRKARQGEVGIVIDSKYYGISRYDPPKT